MTVLEIEAARPDVLPDAEAIAAELALRPCLADFELHTLRYLGGPVAFCTTCGEILADLPASIVLHLQLLQRVREGLERL